MKRLHFLLCVLFLSLTAGAQTRDASTVYSEYEQYINIVQTAMPNSKDYQLSTHMLLQLQPELLNHVVNFENNGDRTNAIKFAKSYVDMAKMPEFQAFDLDKQSNYPMMVYFIASHYYNQRDYENAADYLSRYIDCDDQEHRKPVLHCLLDALTKLGQTERLLNTLNTALSEYPNDSKLLNIAIQTRMNNGWYEESLPYIDAVLGICAEDSTLDCLVMTQYKGMCLEAVGMYDQAAEVYLQLSEQRKSLSIYKHCALNLFNAAVQYNSLAPEIGKKYFERAIPLLKKVVANDPTSLQYITALAQSYYYTDQFGELSATNNRLRAIGGEEIDATGKKQFEVALMESSDIKRSTTQMPQLEENEARLSKSASHVSTPIAQTQPEQKVRNNSRIDYYSYRKNYVDEGIKVWQQKEAFETLEEYKERVTEEKRNEKVNALIEEAKQEYIAKYKKQVRRSDFSLNPNDYDAENNAFLINSQYGEIILTVPREQNQAREFANGWNRVIINNPVLDLAGNDLVVRSIDFVTADGKTYHYSDENEAKFVQVDINLQFDDVDWSEFNKSDNNHQKVNIEKRKLTVGESDVDINIPPTRKIHEHTFAFIIGNENYKRVSPVAYALNDANSMGEYFNKTLGIPKDNIDIYPDATYGDIQTCIGKMEKIAKTYNGYNDFDVIFYYAGHGMPNESDRSAYLLPIDADGVNTWSCVSLSDLYARLGQLGARSVVVLMDACFSGSQRGEGMLAAARSVALKTETETPQQGKLVTISAATGEETAYPYEEKQHGMFSYYVMKHMQETKGRSTWGRLFDYVMTQVTEQSIRKNPKQQTPTARSTAEASGWRNWNLNK